jgi:hypothetical protein
MLVFMGRSPFNALRVRKGVVSKPPFWGPAFSSHLSAFERATAQRTGRAVGARRQQLREKELTLAYDLARRDAPQRLLLGLKLTELHLDAATRKALESQLAALNGQEGDALAAARRSDAAVLWSYRRQLQEEAATANAQMAAQLRAKGAANDAINLRALQAESNAAAAVPDVPSQLALFRSSYRSAAGAQAIAEGFGAAGVDLSRRFGDLSEVDEQSRAATDAQIQKLTADRTTLYRSIVAQIERIANRLARTRHLTKILVANSRPEGSIDLTAAIQAALTRFARRYVRGPKMMTMSGRSPCKCARKVKYRTLRPRHFAD